MKPINRSKTMFDFRVWGWATIPILLIILTASKQAQARNNIWDAFFNVDPNAVGTPVIVTVTATEIDFLNLGTPGILHIPVPDTFTATVVMAKEGP